MLVFLLVLMLQRSIPAPCIAATTPDDLMNCKGGSNTPDGVYRINGKITVDKGAIPLVDVKLYNDMHNQVQSVQSFANGTFHFDAVPLGRYSIEVVDSRFNLETIQLWLRNPEDTGKVVGIALKSNDGSKPTGDASDISKIIADVERDASVPAAAFEEFRKGMEAIRQRSKDNPPDLHFKNAISTYPDFYEAFYQLGLEQGRQHQTADAVRSLVKASALKPELASPLAGLGRAYVEDNQFPRAVESFSKLGGMTTLTAEDRYFLGQALFKMDNTQAAQQQFSISVSLAPGKNPLAYVQLANCYGRNGDSDSALKTLDDYLRLFPNDPNRKAVEAGANKLRDSIKKSKP